MHYNSIRIFLVVRIITILWLPGFVHGQKKTNNQDANRIASLVRAEFELARGDTKKTFDALGEYFHAGGDDTGKKILWRNLAQAERYDIIADQTNDFKDDLEMQSIYIQALLTTQREKDACALLRELAIAHPENEQIALLFVMLHAQAKEYDEAFGAIDRFLSSSSPSRKHSHFYFLKAKLHLQRKEYEKALVATAQATKLYARHKKAWLMKALLEQQLGNNDQAIDGLRRYLSLKGDDQIVERQLIDLLVAQGHHQEAIKIHQTHNDDSAEYYFEHALIESKAQEIKNAISDVELSLTRDPKLAAARLLAMQLYLSEKNIDAMLATLFSWIEADFAAHEAFEAVFIAQKSGVSADELINGLEKIAKTLPKHKNIRATLLDLYLMQKNYAKIFDLSLELTSLTHDQLLLSRLWYLCGYCAFRKKEYSTATDYLKKACACTQIYAPALNLQAYLNVLTNKDLAHAHKYSKLLIKHFPENPAFLDTYGCVLARLGKKEQAQKIFMNALSRAPHDPIIKKHLARIQ